jgi:hypothetical protein
MIREALNTKLFAVHISSTGRAALVSGGLHLCAKVFVTTPIVGSIYKDIRLAMISCTASVV